MHFFVPTSPPAFASNFHNVVGLSTLAYLAAAERHRADRQPRRSCHRSNAAPAQRIGLGSCPQATRTFIHRRRQQAPFSPDQLLGVHRERRSCRRDPVDPQSTTIDRLVLTRALSLYKAERLRNQRHWYASNATGHVKRIPKFGPAAKVV